MCIQHSTVEGGPPDGGGRCDLDPRQEYPLLHLQTTEVLWKEHGTGTKTHIINMHAVKTICHFFILNFLCTQQFFLYFGPKFWLNVPIIMIRGYIFLRRSHRILLHPTACSTDGDVLKPNANTCTCS